MTENITGRRTVTYRAALPKNPADWTLGLIRQFVKDADSQGIPGSTHVMRFPENDSWAFQADNRYYGLGVERIVDLDEVAPPPLHFNEPCSYPECTYHPHDEWS